MGQEQLKPCTTIILRERILKYVAAKHEDRSVFVQTRGIFYDFFSGNNNHSRYSTDIYGNLEPDTLSLAGYDTE